MDYTTKVEVPEYLIEMLNVQEKSAWLAKAAMVARPTDEMLAAPVTGQLLLRVVEAEASALKALSRRIAALEQKAGG